jgi:hypothetical protein
MKAAERWCDTRNGSQICTRCIEQPQVGYATLFAPSELFEK